MKNFQTFLQENESRDPGGKIMKMIDRDFKYNESKSPIVTEHRRESIETVEAWLRGEAPLAQYGDDKYRCVIMPNHRELCFKEGDPTPVPMGRWMDWHEKHWEMSGARYRKMPTAARAERECREQVEKWVADEYEDLKLDFWEPNNEWPHPKSTSERSARFRAIPKRRKKKND